MVNSGIYYISTEIYKEFEKQQHIVEEDIKLQNMIDNLDTADNIEADLDIETTVPYDHTKMEPIDLMGQLSNKTAIPF